MTKYFDAAGEELHHPFSMDNKTVSERFPGVKAVKYDGYRKIVAYSKPNAMPSDPWTPVVRMIDWKATKTPHKCDSRCENARGHNCECSCGGKNHGKNRNAS